MLVSMKHSVKLNIIRISMSISFEGILDFVLLTVLATHSGEIVYKPIIFDDIVKVVLPSIRINF